MSGFLRQIALSPGKLNEQEMQQIRQHSSIGAKLVEPIQEPLPISPLINGHHERWDGLGYPQGLKEEQIPLGSRILAVVDFFVAKITSRGYRSPSSLGEALKDIKAASGTQLDPTIVDVFIDLWHRKGRLGDLDPMQGMKCWEFKSCPAYIHNQCPAYNQLPTQCWKVSGVHCEKHGNSCEDCPVHSAHRFGQELMK